MMTIDVPRPHSTSSYKVDTFNRVGDVAEEAQNSLLIWQCFDPLRYQSRRRSEPRLAPRRPRDQGRMADMSEAK
jgi:hypothetical protein